jgi:hypothetical protein
MEMKLVYHLLLPPPSATTGEASTVFQSLVITAKENLILAGVNIVVNPSMPKVPPRKMFFSTANNFAGRILVLLPKNS